MEIFFKKQYSDYDNSKDACQCNGKVVLIFTTAPTQGIFQQTLILKFSGNSGHSLVLKIILNAHLQKLTSPLLCHKAP